LIMPKGESRREGQEGETVTIMTLRGGRMTRGGGMPDNEFELNSKAMIIPWAGGKSTKQKFS